MVNRIAWSVVAVLAVGLGGWSAKSVLTRPGADSSHPAKSAADVRQREILEQDIDRPGDPVLMSRYASINTKHFAGRLTPMPVLWEARLDEVGRLAGRTFTLEGMFGRLGRRTAILLNPSLQADPLALDRALCHEMAHASLFLNGDAETTHGPAFQAVLSRLADEGAFTGIVSTDADRARLRAWLDEESERLNAERDALDRLHDELERERADVERNHAGVEAYNGRAESANARAVRARDDQAEFNRQVDRYNLMLVYPDGQDEPLPPFERKKRAQ